MLKQRSSAENFEEPLSSLPFESTTLTDGSSINLSLPEAQDRLSLLANFYQLVMAKNPISPEGNAFYDLLRWVNADPESCLSQESEEVLMSHRVLPLEPSSSASWGELRVLYKATLVINKEKPWAITPLNPLKKAA